MSEAALNSFVTEPENQQLATVLEFTPPELTAQEATYRYFKWLNQHYPLAGVAEFRRDEQNEVYIVAKNGDRIYDRH